jgi:hypothetical protein
MVVILKMLTAMSARYKNFNPSTILYQPQSQPATLKDM